MAFLTSPNFFSTVSEVHWIRGKLSLNTRTQRKGSKISVESIPDITGVFTHWNGTCLPGKLLILWSGCFIEAGSLMTFNIIARFSLKRGFPGSAADKESACNTGDTSLIPESGRSPGEGIGFPLQYYCASLGAQLIKNSPAMRETRVKSLGWEDPLEKGTATHWYSRLENFMDYSMGSQRVGHDRATFTFTLSLRYTWWEILILCM